MGACLHDSGRHGRKETPMTPEERISSPICSIAWPRWRTPSAIRRPNADQGRAAQAPNAVYALVQTALVQEEALKRAEARIRELEDAGQHRRSARPAFSAACARPVRPARTGAARCPRCGRPRTPGMSPAWRTTSVPPMPARPPPAMGARRAPAGRRLVSRHRRGSRRRRDRRLAAARRHPLDDGRHGTAHAAFDPAAGGGGSSPWGGDSGSVAGSEMARQTGLDDIGRAPAGGGGRATLAKACSTTAGAPTTSPAADDQCRRLR